MIQNKVSLKIAVSDNKIQAGNYNYIEVFTLKPHDFIFLSVHER